MYSHPIGSRYKGLGLGLDHSIEFLHLELTLGTVEFC